MGDVEDIPHGFGIISGVPNMFRTLLFKTNESLGNKEKHMDFTDNMPFHVPPIDCRQTGPYSIEDTLASNL